MLTALLAAFASTMFATGCPTFPQILPRDLTTPKATDNAWFNATLRSPETGTRACDCPAFGDICFIVLVEPPDYASNPDWVDEIGPAVSLA